MTRTVKIILVIFILAGLPLLLSGCGSGPDESKAAENQAVTVQRGTLVIDITAVGNLALSRVEDLAFDIFYPEATVAEVLVAEGDTVEEGQLLAKLDTAEWGDELSALEDRVTAAERSVTAAERQLTAKQRDLIQADINLRNARIALEQTDTRYTVYDFKAAEADVDVAERNLQEVIAKLASYDLETPGYESYQKLLLQAQAGLDTAEATLEAMLADFDTEEVVIKKLQIQINEIRLVEAQNAIEDAQTASNDARKELRDAQEELDEAKSQSPEVRATFDGFITKVNVEGGDEVMRGTVAVQLADPNKFEAEILVGEMDILQVRLGGSATVQVDAMPGVSLTAEVTHISPTAIISQGVVNYTVKVTLRSMEDIAQQRPALPPGAVTENITPGEFPGRLQQAIAAGRITQEQAEDMVRQFPQGEGRQPGGQQRHAPTMLPEDFQLREGLTVIVSIIVDQRSNVLLVPNSAITTQGAQTFVQVLVADGTLEQRVIQTGISDYQLTEVTDGLGEGEQIIVPQGTAVTTSGTQQGQSRRGGIFIPGMGRVGGGGGDH